MTGPYSLSQTIRQGLVGFNERLAKGLDTLTDAWNLTASAWTGDPARVGTDSASRLFGEKSIEAPANDLEATARTFGRGTFDAAALLAASAAPGAPAALKAMSNIQAAGPARSVASEVLAGGSAAVGAELGGIPGAIAGAVAPAALLRSSIPKTAAEISELAARGAVKPASVAQAADAAAPPPSAAVPAVDMAADAVLKAAPDDATKAFNINLTKIDSPEAARSAIYNVAETFKGQIDEARRGVITDEQARGLADDLGMTVDKLLKRRKGEAFNAEQVLAARQILVNSANDLQIVAKKAQGGSDTDLVAFKEAISRHVAIQEQVSGMTAEAGRALRQFKQAVAPQQIKTLIDNMGGRDSIEDLAGKLANLDPHQINVFAREASKATTSDMLVEAWKSALLSAPTTHAVNILSNTATMLWDIPENFVAAGVGAVRSGTDKVYFREAAVRTFGLLQGIKDGLKVAAHTAKGDIDLIDDLNKPEIFGKAIPGPVGSVIRTPLAALSVEDAFFKTIGRRMELNALAMRTGIQQGLKGKDLGKHIAEFIADPPKDAIAKAEDFARYVTFNRQVGNIGKALMDVRGKHPVLNLLFPFVRTPVNIIKYAIERTPAAKVLSHVRAETAAGGASADKVSARMFLGSAAAGLVFHEATEGKITGNGPVDPEARAMLRSSGWQPYSVKIGDKYYAYGRIEPAGIVAGMAADAAEIWQQLDSDDQDKLARAIAAAVARNITSKTWLQGINDLVQATSDPDRYGHTWLQRMSGTVVPTVVAHTARLQDPTLRDVQSVLDNLKSRTPGFSESLPARRNLWGDPITLGGAWGPDWLSPIYQSTDLKDPVMQEMIRLKINPTLPRREIGDYKIPPERYWQLVAEAGRPAKQILDNLVNAPEWQNIPDPMREEAILEVITKTRRAAQEKLKAEVIKERGIDGALELNPKARKILEGLQKK
jgi:hypothetical protein